MCGIAGFTGDKNQKLLKAMNDTLVHRGPDDEGYYSNGRVNLAMRRLSIVDIAGGHQPISNEDDTIWVVFNGEIYNYIEIRKSLEEKGHKFKTDHSDTEVIVHLYEEYGDEWPVHVNGMFGLAIWDERKKRLLLYRDRIGKKPVYYSNKNSELIFASEIKALLEHPDITRKPDLKALYGYFGLKNISSPSTAYSDIKQLLPGHYLEWKDGEIKTRPYWKLDFSHINKDISEEDAADRLLELLEDAVKVRMRCDAPYGAYLSGGVDSSSVVVLMSRNQTEPVKTFCLGYEDDPMGQFVGKQDDILHAKGIARKLGTEHFEYILSADKFAEHMTGVLSAFDEPFSGTVSTFFLSILIHKHVKVAISGDGADELFGSYLTHRLAQPIENYLKFSAKGKSSWGDLKQNEKDLLYPFNSSEQFTFLKGIASSKLSEWREKLHVFTPGQRKELLKGEFLEGAGYPHLKDIYSTLEGESTARDTLNKVLEIDQKELLPNQVLPFVDRLSMAHSVEVRCPYLDYRIIEFANSLPYDYKIHNGINKYIHKKAMEKLIPRGIIERPKEGFVQPIYSWMHGSLKGWVKDNLNDLPRDIFNLDYVKALEKDFDSADNNINNKVWNLVCFSIWYRNVYNKK